MNQIHHFTVVSHLVFYESFVILRLESPFPFVPHYLRWLGRHLCLRCRRPTLKSGNNHKSDMENANENCPGPESETAGKSDSCAGCPNQEACSTAPKGPDPDLVAIAERMATVQEISLIDVRKGVNFCKKIGVPVLGVVENMSGLSQPLTDIKFMKLVTETGSSIDVTQDMISCIRDNAPELLNVVACSQVFDTSGGGAERMCREMGVPFLGKVPLDPQLCRAAEQGKSCFEDNKCSVSAPALKSIIEKVVASIKMKEDVLGGE